MEKNYIAKNIESKIYQKWLKEKAFQPQGTGNSYSIVLPPPNVTGILHIGHALDATVPDLLCRYKRMQGYKVLFLPGTDHAGIATEAKVTKVLAEQGKKRLIMGREAFVSAVLDYKEKSIETIHQQWSSLGTSMDFSRERFTMDDLSNRSVKAVFKKLYQAGLIYRGERIINYDIKLKTALSDVEVIYREAESSMYHFAYKLAEDKKVSIIVATTRPETMFGDTAVFVNPDDERYKKYHGKMVVNPANNKLIPLLADRYVEKEFGTGAMKCTPCHDHNDFALGKKYQLDFINVMNYDGTMNEMVPEKYRGLDRLACRQVLVEDLKASGFLVKTDKHLNQIGYSERSDEIIEPLVSLQWFVRMKPLAELAIKNQKNDDKVHFHPERFEKVFLNWLENIEDWCISRQIWWGHRIPVWYHKVTGEMIVGDDPESEDYYQDKDVLDTWFSSTLWPFSTLGWLDDHEDFYNFYSTDVMSAGSDLIFFWVARMILQGLFNTGRKPFKHVLLHGLIRDDLGRKVSKSLNNGKDLNQEIATYGADSLRFFLLTNTTPGMDFRYVDEKMISSRNFINKIWNASRYIYMNKVESSQAKLSAVDSWFLSHLNQIIVSVTDLIENYELALAGSKLYDFVYDIFCSWYIELSKIIYNNEFIQNSLKTILKLLHPFIPFVTEEIYNILFDQNATMDYLSWPVVEDNANSADVEMIDNIINLIKQVRADNQSSEKGNIKKEYFIESKYDYQPYEEIFKKLLAAQEIKFQGSSKEGRIYIEKNLSLKIVYQINEEEELSRLKEQLIFMEKEIDRADGLLKNQGFISKASAEKIASEKEKLSGYQAKKDNILKEIAKIKK